MEILSDCWGVLVAAGGVAYEEFRSLQSVAVSLLELSSNLKSQVWVAWAIT